MAPYYTLKDVNGMELDAFIKAFGDVAEHSPWVARAAYEARPFKSADGMITAFSQAVMEASPKDQKALICAHPDLAGKAAVMGALAQDSSSEQKGAGLNTLTAEEFARFTDLNTRYRARFDFPFILAVKGATKGLILASFEERIKNGIDAEFSEALTQICRIIRFRLEDRLS